MNSHHHNFVSFVTSAMPYVFLIVFQISLEFKVYSFPSGHTYEFSWHLKTFQVTVIGIDFVVDAIFIVVPLTNLTFWFLLPCSIPAIDIWSVWCIFAEVSTGKPLFPGKSVVHLHHLDLITDLLGTSRAENRIWGTPSVIFLLSFWRLSFSLRFLTIYSGS